MGKKPLVLWDEPTGAATPRGWYMIGGICRGFYLDYGKDHYRSPHRDPLSDRVWCDPNRKCPTCEPGNILACRYPDGPGTPNESMYVETIDQARRFVETGKKLAPGEFPPLPNLIVFDPSDVAPKAGRR